MTLTEQLKKLADGSAQRHSGEAQAIMKSAIDELITSSILDQAFKKGQIVPEIILPNATGALVNLNDILSKQKVVLTFYRGGWCPYCNVELKALQNALPQIEARGAKLIAISPETPDNSLSTKEKNELSFEVLSDANNEVARALNLVFKLPDSLQRLYFDKFKIDLSQNQGNENQELPIAATYVIEQNGMISYHFLAEDYKLRADPADILEVI